MRFHLPAPNSEGESRPGHTGSFLISWKLLVNVTSSSLFFLFFFLLNGKHWVSCSDEPALHQVLVIPGVCARLPLPVRSWQETLCGDTLRLQS